MVKMADEMLEDEDSEVKNFFEHVIGKTEEILSQNSFARSERHISEVLTHIDEEIDSIIQDFIARHGSTTGKTYLRGHSRAMGYTVQRRRIRESLNRVDPRNTGLRWGALVSRRVYFVLWPNSLWHS